MTTDLQRTANNKYLQVKDPSPVRTKTGKAAKKRKEQRRKHLVIWYGCVFLLIAAMAIFAKVKESRHETQRQQADVRAINKPAIDTLALGAVDRTMRDLFVRGSWRYQGSEVDNNQVHVYIQMPQPMQSQIELQRQYIKSSLCPKPDNPLWKQIKPVQVKLHLYAWVKSKTVAATCV